MFLKNTVLLASYESTAPKPTDGPDATAPKA